MASGAEVSIGTGMVSPPHLAVFVARPVRVRAGPDYMVSST